jgi:hypothetical protein
VRTVNFESTVRFGGVETIGEQDPTPSESDYADIAASQEIAYGLPRILDLGIFPPILGVVTPFLCVIPQEQESNRQLRQKNLLFPR